MTRSPRRIREQVKDTATELPIQAARLAVMGVGRALLLTDRVRKDYRDARESGLGPVLGRLKNDAGNITGKVMGKVSRNGRAEKEPKSPAGTDSEISVGKPKPATPPRPASSQRPTAPAKPATAPPARPAEASRPKPATEPKATEPKPKASPAPTAAPTPETTPQASAPKAADAEPAAKASPPAKPAAKAKTAADLPVPGYDEAPLASVRARLRGLDEKQVGELRDYERAHAARADFLRMYENRIAKLRGER